MKINKSQFLACFWCLRKVFLASISDLLHCWRLAEAVSRQWLRNYSSKPSYDLGFLSVSGRLWCLKQFCLTPELSLFFLCKKDFNLSACHLLRVAFFSLFSAVLLFWNSLHLCRKTLIQGGLINVLKNPNSAWFQLSILLIKVIPHPDWLNWGCQHQLICSGSGGSGLVSSALLFNHFWCRPASEKFGVSFEIYLFYLPAASGKYPSVSWTIAF